MTRKLLLSAVLCLVSGCGPSELDEARQAMEDEQVVGVGMSRTMEFHVNALLKAKTKEAEQQAQEVIDAYQILLLEQASATGKARRRFRLAVEKNRQ